MSFIGIDLGTSFIKAAVLDLETPSITHVQRMPFPESVAGLPPQHSEVDPLEIVSIVTQLLDRLLAQAPDCSGIVMCNQMSSLVLIDDRGRPLSNCIGWRDQRALEPHPGGEGTHFDILFDLVGAARSLQMGNELRPGIPASFLFWMANKGKLPPGSTPVSLGDFVVANLCGSQPCTEPTNGSAHGVLDLLTLNWHGEVISRLGLDHLKWPALHNPKDPAGYFKFGSKRIPWFPPVGDQQCALAGTLLEPGELWINVSTGSQVSLLTPRPEFGDFRTRPSVDGGFYKTITHIPAGRSLSVLVDLLTEIPREEGLSIRDPWSYIIRSAEEAGETDLRTDLAFFPGPCGDRGEIGNVREDNLRVGHLFRAAFENMADNYQKCALQLSPERGWERLAFSGGLAQRIELLRRLISQKLGVQYRVAASSEDTMLGLLSMALVFSGRVASFDQAAKELRWKFKLTE